MNADKNTQNICTKHLFHRFEKQPVSLYLVYDDLTSDYSFITQYDTNYFSNNIHVLFTITPFLLGYFRGLKYISFTRIKTMIIDAVRKDINSCNKFDKNSYLFDVLVNKLAIKLYMFKNFQNIQTVYL